MVLEGILIIIAFVIGFFLGKDRELKLVERVKEIKKAVNETKGPFVISTDEADIERAEQKEEEDKIDIKDIIK